MLTIRPFIKLVTSEIKFTHVAKDYKQNIKKDFSEDRTFSADKSKNKKNEDDYISLDLQITLKMFEDFKYDLNSIRLGQAVKPVYLSKLPKDLNKMKSTQKKKNTFIKIVMPLILDENEKILEDRKKLFKILNKPSNSRGEKVWLKRRFKEYQVENEEITELKLRMDIIPTSLAIAQAAKESGWGTSRFALDGNAMFGQWTWSENGIEPSKKSNNQSHKILKFPMLQSSVKAYLRNLNTHRGYKELRQTRAKLRSQNKNISGLDLVDYLYNYAATGSEYVKVLRKIITQNNLIDFDEVEIIGEDLCISTNRSIEDELVVDKKSTFSQLGLKV